MSTNLPAKPKSTPQIVAIKQYVEQRQANIEKLVAGTGISLQRFLQLALNQTLRVPDLLACSKESWFDALQACATHGLLPDGIHGALVPYKSKVTFQPMYQGLVQRAYQTRMVTKIWAEVVYEGEAFSLVLGMDPSLAHTPKPDRGDAKQLVGCYACARVNGETHFVFMYPQEVARHKASSKTASRSDSPWNTHPAEMWKKTAIIALSKTLPHFHADASKFADLVSEDGQQDRGEIIDVSFMDVQDDRSDIDKAKERLRQQQPQPPASDPEPTKERQPGEDDGDERPERPGAGCQTNHATLITPRDGHSIECPECGRAFSRDEMLSMKGGR